MNNKEIAIVLSGMFSVFGCDRLGLDSTQAEEPATPDSSAAEAEAASEVTAAAETDNAFAPLQVAAGYHVSYTRLAGGQVRAWGQNQRGELGDGRSAIGGPFSMSLDAASPAALKGLGDVMQISVGHSAVGAASNTACAITEAHKVYCWGEGDLIPVAADKDEPAPIEIPALAGARKITMGLGHACALMGDGSAKCWGGNYYGQLGNGKAKTDSRVPVAVSGLEGAVDIAAAYYQVCAATEAGAVMCWGSNDERELTPASTEDQAKPAAVPGIEGAVSVGLTGNQSCAVHGDGRLSCWGKSAEAIEVVASGVQKVTGNSEHMCLLANDTTVHCWGSNDEGQLGQGKAGTPYSSDRPLPVPGLSGVIDIAVGYEHACAATEAEEVVCWGRNRFGELGDGTLADRAAPVQVKGVASPKLAAPSPGFGTAPQGPTAQTWNDLPKGCVHQEQLDAKHPALLGKPFVVRSATAERGSEGRITVKLANYHLLDAEGRVVEPRGDQLSSNLYFIEVEDPSNGEDKDVRATPGDFRLSYEGNKRYMGAMSSIYNAHTGYELRTGATAESRVELTVANTEWACGVIDVTNEYGHFKGSFAAAMRQ